ncbi:MAG: nucleoside deaminase [Candidatus Poribacteria bacterium]|nr:nucleoside deaminase [Candidatus Poribacteria bacterium]
MFFVTKRDEHWMGEALKEAREAMKRGETPVGAVIERGGIELARDSNRRRERQDPTAHAEIGAIRKAARKTGSETLDGATLYVTVEPCAMCAGAVQWARIDRVVYGIDEPKSGAVRSRYTLLADAKTGKAVPSVGGCRADEALKLMQDFFASLRASAR